MKRLDLDHWPPLVSITVLLICSGLLWADYQAAHDSAQGEVLGRVIQARGTLQRKGGNAVIFQNTKEQGPLHSGDTLRTSHSSRAVIQLNSGIKITLGEFSMVQLTRSRERLDVRLNQGSIRVRSRGRALQIRSGSRGVGLTNGELNLERRADSGLRIEMRKGRARITAGGRTHVLEENQLAEIRKKKTGIRSIAFSPNYPADGALFFAPDGKKLSVRFAWAILNSRKAASRPLLQIARTSDFTKTVSSRRMSDDSTTANLAPGAYYWRLRRADDISETRFLIIKPLQPAHLLQPEAGTVFRLVETAPRVDFAWLPGTTPADYTIELSNNANFKTLARSLKCKTTGISLNLEPGIYYWRVQARLRVNPANRTSSNRDVTVYSDVRTFRVRKTSTYLRPVPLAPASGAAVSATTARTAGLLFSWRGPAEIVRWEWNLAGDAAFTSRVQSAGARRPYALLKGPLKLGYSYWRVRGFDSKGRATPYSLPVRFRVVETPAMASIAPPHGTRVASPRILFRWRTGGVSSAFRFNLADTQDMQAPLISRLLYGHGLDLKTPAPGRYFWRVDIVRNGSVVASGPVHDFTVSPPPDTPSMLYPGKGLAVDMSARERLDFRWKSVKNASQYRLRLYHIKRERTIRVLDIRTRATAYSLRDLTKLDIGNFAWSVTSVDNGNRESPESRVPFQVELKNRPSIPRIKASGAD